MTLPVPLSTPFPHSPRHIPISDTEPSDAVTAGLTMSFGNGLALIPMLAEIAARCGLQVT